MLEDFRKMKVITSLRDFLIYNNIRKLTCENYVANYLENNYIGFLSSGNSHILFRDITNKNQIRWYKYPITKESSTNRILNLSINGIEFTGKEVYDKLGLKSMDFSSMGIYNNRRLPPRLPENHMVWFLSLRKTQILKSE